MAKRRDKVSKGLAANDPTKSKEAIVLRVVLKLTAHTLCTAKCAWYQAVGTGSSCSSPSCHRLVKGLLQSNISVSQAMYDFPNVHFTMREPGGSVSTVSD
jgi:hypothetical protein